jgi:hypothetical protein
MIAIGAGNSTIFAVVCRSRAIAAGNSTIVLQWCAAHVLLLLGARRLSVLLLVLS